MQRRTVYGAPRYVSTLRSPVVVVEPEGGVMHKVKWSYVREQDWVSAGDKPTSELVTRCGAPTTGRDAYRWVNVTCRVCLSAAPATFRVPSEWVGR